LRLYEIDENGRFRVLFPNLLSIPRFLFTSSSNPLLMRSLLVRGRGSRVLLIWLLSGVFFFFEPSFISLPFSNHELFFFATFYTAAISPRVPPSFLLFFLKTLSGILSNSPPPSCLARLDVPRLRLFLIATTSGSLLYGLPLDEYFSPYVPEIVGRRLRRLLSSQMSRVVEDLQWYPGLGL